jgi:uncharacterized protein YxeA
MKKALPIIVLIVILAGGGIFVGSRLLSQDKGEVVTQEQEKQEAEVPQEEDEEEGESFVGELKDALSLGKSMECTWRKDDNNFGTAYIKNEKVYTEVTAEGEEMYAIVADYCTYWWEKDKTEGYKICVEPSGEEEVEPATEAFSWETPEISYSCKPTVISDAKFNPPSSIQFTDLLESMQDLNLPTGQ